MKRRLDNTSQESLRAAAVSLCFLLLVPGAGADTEDTIENLAFAEQVNLLYVVYYGRPADPGGLRYWESRLAAVNGDCAGELVNAFGDSEEYRDRFGNLEYGALIDNLYSQSFNRAADPVGLSFYVDLLEGTNDSGLNDNFRQTTLAALALDIANGAQGGDRDVLDLKVETATYFTSQVEILNVSYGADEIPVFVDLIAAANDNPAVTSEFLRFCVDRVLEGSYTIGSCQPGNATEFEPNDESATATAIDITSVDTLLVRGNVGVEVVPPFIKDEVDVFSFAVSDTAIYTFAISPGFTVVIRDASGKGWGLLTEETGSVVDLPLLAGEFYTAEVRPVSGFDSVEEGDYEFRIENARVSGNDPEPNGDFQLAADLGDLLIPGTGNRRFLSTRGSFDDATDPLDVFAFELGELSFLRVALDLQILPPDFENTQYETCLYTSDELAAACSTDGELVLEGVPAGEYYVGAEATATDVPTPYALGLSAAAYRQGGAGILDAAAFPTQLTEVAGRVGDQVMASEAWYTLIGEETRGATVRLLLPEDANVEVVLFDENLNTLGIAGPTSSSFDVDLQQGVQYFFQVRQTDSAGGFYLLSILDR